MAAGGRRKPKLAKGEIIMPTSVNVKVTPFGQMTLMIGGPAHPVEEHARVPVKEEVWYQEPPETAPRLYEVRYDEESMMYVAPPSTG